MSRHPQPVAACARSSSASVVMERTSDHRTRATGTTPTPLSRLAMTRFSCFASTVWNTPLTSTLRDDAGPGDGAIVRSVGGPSSRREKSASRGEGVGAVRARAGRFGADRGSTNPLKR